MINFVIEFRTTIGLKSMLFRQCERWTVYGVVRPSVGPEMLSNLGLFSDHVSDCSVAEIIVVYDSSEGCLKLN